MLNLFAITLLALVPSAAQPATPIPIELDQPTFEERLDLLVERIEQERIKGHIPGLALAVVKDDKIVLARGFGLADVSSKRAVSPETIFAIGSSTKAFTATALGMLQDDGELDFDDPVTKHLPYFDLQIDGEGEVTLRDLMSHRTGFTRMTALWAGGNVPSRRMLETATKAEPTAGFREKFQYNNVMFLAAGTAGGAANGSTWSELVQDRILSPLGMNSTSLSTKLAQSDERLAMGYVWNPDTESYDKKKMLELEAIGPAGSINSNVLDMAQWLRFQLGRGEHAGTRLLQAETLDETWTQNMAMSETSGYGLGWMLRGEGADLVVEHGGNIDGFAAEVAMMPAENLGFVLLTNVTATPLQGGSLAIVFDTLLEDIVEEEAVEASSFDGYIGHYTANFGTFKNADFEVSVQNGNLAVNVPGQMNFELHPENDEGKWVFRYTDEIAISFMRSGDGSVIEMKMYQSGMTFTMPREGVVQELEIPLDQLTKFLGHYADEARGIELEAVIQNGHLAVDVPKQMIFEMYPPGEDGKRIWRVTDEIATRFNEDEDGVVVSLTMFERGAVRELQRVGDAPEQTRLPNLDEFFALRKVDGRTQLMIKHGTFRETGTMRMPQSGIEGTYVYEGRYDPPAYRMTTDMGAFGSVVVGVDGDTAWSHNVSQGLDIMSGGQRLQAVRAHPAIMGGDWRKTYDTVEVLRSTEHEGAQYIVAQLDFGDLPETVQFIDAKTGELKRTEMRSVYGTMQFPMVTEFSDFRDFEGVQLAYCGVQSNPLSGKTEMRATKIEVGIKLDADFASFKDD